MIKKELQQELNRTKLILDYAREEIKEKDKEIERLNNIIDKAIEYIRQLEFESEELYDISEIARLELLDILKGSDKE